MPVHSLFMCLLVFAWRAHPEFPLILAGNRDEFHERPSQAAHWWSGPDGILAGKDLRGGGSWLGINRRGRFAVVTNYREPNAPTSGRRSRGELVTGFLTSAAPVADWIGAIEAGRDDYGGYNLIAGDADELHYLTNRGAAGGSLEPGIYGLSNHRLDTPWPKVAAAKEHLRRFLAGGEITTPPLFELLSDRRPAADAELPDTGVPRDWERLLSAAFIVSPSYGTRVSTAVLMRRDGAVEFEERRFGPDGEPAGVSRFDLVVGD
jgi:uncharacterized protein with NRDE domain